MSDKEGTSVDSPTGLSQEINNLNINVEEGDPVIKNFIENKNNTGISFAYFEFIRLLLQERDSDKTLWENRNEYIRKYMEEGFFTC